MTQCEATHNVYDFLVGTRFDSAAPVLQEGDVAISYRMLHEQVLRYSIALRQTGITAGDCVAIQAGKSGMAVMLYLAVLRIGAVYLPLNTDYTLRELDHFIVDAAPRLLLGDAGQKAALADRFPATQVQSLQDLNTAAQACDLSMDRGSAPVRKDDISAILYTSGTTGAPKGAMLMAENLISNTRILVDAWSITAEDVLIHALPIFHAHGLFVALNTLLHAGGVTILLPKFEAEPVMGLFGRATLMMGVPTFYERLVRHEGLQTASASHMRLFISGSAPLRADTHAKFAALTGHAILERYGMTETIMITSNPLNGDRRGGTVGRPLPGIEVRVADRSDNRPLPVGEVGVVQLKGPNVFKGYRNLPEQTRREFTPDGYFITGDMGVADDQGYITIVGRAKDLIISGGYNVYPREVEIVINEVTDVVESAVIAVPHPDFGEAVVAVVVAGEGIDLAQRISLACHSALARYKHPKRIILVPDLPRNALGKIQKNLLRDQYRSIFTNAA